jgi:hypothetical protein
MRRLLSETNVGARCGKAPNDQVEADVKDRAKVNGILKSNLRKCVFARHARQREQNSFLTPLSPSFKENDHLQGKGVGGVDSG